MMDRNKKLTWQVSRERWQQAQSWELRLWQRADRLSGPIVGRVIGLIDRRHRSVDRGDDWNHWWAERFKQYRDLPLEMDTAIELGCGPYTNMRLIRPGRNIRRVYCSDPLAREYAAFKAGWLARAYRDRSILLDDHPAEELPFANETFDLTVMINVLDHVHDAEACVSTALRITKAGGLFVFGQDLTDDSDPGGDVGHPIMLDHEALDLKVLPHCEVVLREVLTREAGRNPQAHYGTYVFIGKKHA